jgi:hypothetical protein
MSQKLEIAAGLVILSASISNVGGDSYHVVNRQQYLLLSVSSSLVLTKDFQILNAQGQYHRLVGLRILVPWGKAVLVGILNPLFAKNGVAATKF